MMQQSSSTTVDAPDKHHASLPSVQEAISSFIQNGCHPSKMIMGIPAYGRHSQNLGLVKTYSEIIDDIVENEIEEGEDISEVIQTTNSYQGYRFDSPQDVRAKVQYAKTEGLGGVFFWELGQDKQMDGVGEGGILLEAAATAAADAENDEQSEKDEL